MVFIISLNITTCLKKCLKRSRDCILIGLRVWVFGYKDMWIVVCSSPHLVRFGHLLICADKRNYQYSKVYIERNNMQVELIRFRKKIFTLLTFT